MESSRHRPVLGAIACLGVLATLAAPYLVANAPAVGVYYTSGLVGGYVVGLLALVSLACFWSRATGRVDPTTMDGLLAGITLGTFLLAGLWAVTVPGSIVMGLAQAAALAYHRWVLVALAAVVATVGAWNATGVVEADATA